MVVVLHADFSPFPHRDSCCVPPGDGAERWLSARRGAVRFTRGLKSKQSSPEEVDLTPHEQVAL